MRIKNAIDHRKCTEQIYDANPSETGFGGNAEVSQRLRFMQFDESGLDGIKCLKDVVERELPVGLDLFYRQVAKQPEPSHFFSSAKRMKSAKGAQVAHGANIAQAKFNDDYHKNVLVRQRKI